MIYVYLFVSACIVTNLYGMEQTTNETRIQKSCPFSSCKKTLYGSLFNHIITMHNYCIRCSTQFPDRIDTAIHIKLIHKNQNLFKYLLNAQPRDFIKKRVEKSLPTSLHMNNFTLPPMYDHKKQCPYPSCNYTIPDINGYDHIARVHNSCDICQLSFGNRQNIADHIYQEHPEKIKLYAYLIAHSQKYTYSKKYVANTSENDLSMLHSTYNDETILSE